MNCRKQNHSPSYENCLLQVTAFFCILIFWATPISAEPHIDSSGEILKLVVNNRPFLAMSIEDHKTIDFAGNVREEYFKAAKQLLANTVSVSFRWSFFEKKPDVYDTTIIHNIKVAAAKYDLKVIILWLGSNICGHENSVPAYIREDPHKYRPYTRSDGSIAGKTDDSGDGRIYCYSLDGEHQNALLQREEKALQALMRWITKNDTSETFIMLQLENELFVHPELWRPWPPVYLSPAKMLPKQRSYTWDEHFDVLGCSLKVELRVKSSSGCEFEVLITDTTGNPYWMGYVKGRGFHELHVGGTYVARPSHAKIQMKNTCNNTVLISEVRIKPIPERCYCPRCREIYSQHRFVSDADFTQSSFLNYVKQLARAVSSVNPNFPIYLNLLVSGDARALLGNPYGKPWDYLNQIPEIDFIAPDIYLESNVGVIDSLNVGRNALFVPETGRFKKRKDPDYIDAFSLIFRILGKYRGIGVQIYDLKSADYGLLTPDGDWDEDAFLVRNSFSVIRLLPSDVFYNADNALFGFRNVKSENFSIDGLKIKIKPNSEPKYARGILAKVNNILIIAGIGFQAQILPQHDSLISIQQGFWEDGVFESCGNPKLVSYDITPHKITIMLDDDDFSGPQDFDPADKQYCVKLVFK